MCVVLVTLSPGELVRDVLLCFDYIFTRRKVSCYVWLYRRQFLFILFFLTTEISAIYATDNGLSTTPPRDLCDR